MHHPHVRVGHSIFRSNGVHGDYFFTDEPPIKRTTKKIPLKTYEKGKSMRYQRQQHNSKLNNQLVPFKTTSMAQAVHRRVPVPPVSHSSQRVSTLDSLKPAPPTTPPKPRPRYTLKALTPYVGDDSSEGEEKKYQGLSIEKDWVPDKITRNPVARMPYVEASRSVAPYWTSTVDNPHDDDELPEVRATNAGSFFPFIPNKNAYSHRKRVQHHTTEAHHTDASAGKELYSPDQAKLGRKRAGIERKNATSTQNMTLQADPSDEGDNTVTFKQVYKRPHMATKEHYQLTKDLIVLHGKARPAHLQ